MMHPDAFAFVKMIAVAGCVFWAARFLALLFFAVWALLPTW